jgi:hypothetical protein
MRLFRVLSLIGALALGIPSAQATILYAGTDDVDTTCSAGVCTVDTNAASYRSAWSRESYMVVGTTADPPTNRIASPVFATAGTAWFHGQYCNDADTCDTTTTANAQLMRVFDDAGNPTLIVRGTGNPGEVKISSRTAGGVFTDIVASCPSAILASVTQLDLKVVYSNVGSVTLYTNSVQVCTFAGDVTNGDGSTLLNKAGFAAAVTGNGAWSETIVATTDTRAMGFWSLIPNANGAQTQWAGSNPCTVILPVAAINIASFISTASNTQTEQCTVTNTPPVGTFAVDAVVMSSSMLRGATGPQHFDFITRTAANVDHYSSDFAPTTAFTNFPNYIQATNPDTASAWLLTDITNAGFQIGLLSKP